MINAIIGTAGHVDHGKTAVIRALTGIECDRLEEEKKRGITIDLGFAHMDIPQIGQVGIVDVPGHEKFVRNMLSGAGGMDLVLLVVDINEGIMPQTTEHLDILSVLGVKKGILVLNKIDLMEESDIGPATEHIRDELKNSFMESAPVALVSAKTGQGIAELKELIIGELAGMWHPNLGQSDMIHSDAKFVDSSSQIPLFLPIDRAFQVKGFGTVVTGTIRSGSVLVGEEYTLYPENKKVTARNIQVHSNDVDVALKGQRVAINIKDISKERDISKEGLQRGHFLTSKDAFTPTMMLDVKLTLLKDSPFGVKNDSLVHFYYGTGEYTAKVVLMDCDYLDAGESAYAQLRFKEELIGRVNDSFVIRYLSPSLTIGGGVILDATPVKKKRNKTASIDGFKIKEYGSFEDRIYEYVREHGNSFLNVRDIPSLNNISHSAASASAYATAHDSEKRETDLSAFNHLLENSRVVILDQKKVITTEQLERYRVHLGRILSDYHQQNVTMIGEPLSEVKEKLLGAKREKDAKALINHFLSEGFIKEEANCISLYHFQHRVLKEDEEIKQRLISIYESAFINPPSYNDMKVGFIGAKGFLSVLKNLTKDGTLIKLDERYYIHKKAYDFAYKKLLMMTPHLDSGEFTLGEYRDRLKCSRKVALAILEHFDREGITHREGEVRKVREVLVVTCTTHHH